MKAVAVLLAKNIFDTAKIIAFEICRKQFVQAAFADHICIQI